MRAANGTYPPKDVQVTRDEAGRVIQFTIGTRPTWSITRDGDGNVLEISNVQFLRTVQRDGNGKVTGVLVSSV